jgi:hypothetical protein
VGELLAAAAADQHVADDLTESFADPPAMWRAIATPEGAGAFLDRHTPRPAPAAHAVATVARSR